MEIKMDSKGSDVKIESREALTQVEQEEVDRSLWGKFIRLNSEEFKPWVHSNEVGILKASDDVRNKLRLKWQKFYGDEPLPDWKITVSDESKTGIPSELIDLEDEPEKVQVESSPSKAPAIIKELDSSTPPKPPESQDVIWLSENEELVGQQINTRDFIVVHDPTLPDSHAGPWVEVCVGRDPHTHQLIMRRLKGRAVKILPEQMMRYRGFVVQDHQSVHTGNVKYQRRRWGYVFDTFFFHNGKRYERCCLVLDRIHQAGLMYEKMVGKQSQRAFSRIRQIKGVGGQATGEPMYEVIGQKEGYYRDLKRLYDRHFLKSRVEELADDIGLKNLIGSG